MQCNIHYSKQSFYDFYQKNMFDRRPWCRQEYNQAWRKIAGRLKGKKAFEKVWQNIKNDLPRAKKRLESLIKKHEDKIRKIIKILSILYQKNVPGGFKLDVQIILLPKNVQSGGGGWGPDKSTIRVEGNLERFGKIRTLEIVLHELIHAYFEDNYFRQKLYADFKDKTDYHRLKEIVASSLLPNGYLSKKYFKQKITPQGPVLLIKEYVNKDKALDIPFIKKISAELNSTLVS